MFYLKTELDGRIQKVDIYDDEIFTACTKCGKEFQVDSDLIMSIFEDDGDFASTSISCGSCSPERPILIRIK